MNRCRRATGLALACVTLACAVPEASSQALRFSISDGGELNEFYRQGPVAAHLVLTPGPFPRLVIAFPAGNSGAALWLEALAAPVSWQPDVHLEAARLSLPGGGMLHGVTADLIARGGPMKIRQALASSVRVIRDYEDTGTVPPEVLATPQSSKRSIVWQRPRLDGAPGYRLSIDVLTGAISRDGQRPIELSPSADGALRMRVTALTGDPPLTPVAADELLTSAAVPDRRLRQILAFLTYEEKLLAGSWRFNTYFGRDTLMSVRLLAPALQPPVMEAGLAAVLERLNAAGEVAHEEDIGEYAVLRRLRDDEPPQETPIYDYRMVDDDFMLAVVAAHYLLGTSAGRTRAAGFLARRTRTGDAYGAALLRNLRFIVAAARPFARHPGWQRLIALKDGEYAGNWRDSRDGLGGGRYAYDVNGVFVPAALDATARLVASGLLQPYLDVASDAVLSEAAAIAEVWLSQAPSLFDVRLSTEAAWDRAEAYARRAGVDPSVAQTGPRNGPLHFRALALDAQGRAVPVLNSDEAFTLLFLDASPAEVERIARVLTRPFPVGLLTDVGLLVANPAYAPQELQATFDRSRYHGTVIWSWQQAMFAAGIDRQLGRRDLTASARAALEEARSRLRAALAAAHQMRGSELWSWSYDEGHYRVAPFGRRTGDETDSNAAQLWSTVYLAQPP